MKTACLALQKVSQWRIYKIVKLSIKRTRISCTVCCNSAPPVSECTGTAVNVDSCTCVFALITFVMIKKWVNNFANSQTSTKCNNTGRQLILLTRPGSFIEWIAETQCSPGACDQKKTSSFQVYYLLCGQMNMHRRQFSHWPHPSVHCDDITYF